MNDNNDELISIIVPVYNVSEYLEECLISIINQSYKNIEIICINDGSTDNSLEILESFQKKDNRIIIINQINKGLSAARNTGLDIAKGKYIGFVDSDDYIDLDMFKMLYESIKKYNTDISICNYYYLLGEEKYIYYESDKDDLINNKEDYLYELLYDCKIQNYVWSRLYKKELFDNVRFPVGTVFEDIYISTCLLDKINSAYYISNPLYYYRRREKSITSNLSIDGICDAVYNSYERYLIIRKEYPKLDDINVYSMISWLNIQYNCFKEVSNDNYFKTFKEIFSELITDDNMNKISFYSKWLNYNEINTMINNYKKYVDSNDNTDINNIDKFDKLLKEFDDYYDVDKDKLKTILDELKETFYNYESYKKYKKKLAIYIDKYGKI